MLLLFTVCIIVFRHLLWCGIHQNKVLCTLQLHIWYTCKSGRYCCKSGASSVVGFVSVAWQIGTVKTGVLLYVFPPIGISFCTVFEKWRLVLFTLVWHILSVSFFWVLIQEACHFDWIELAYMCLFFWWLLCSFLKIIFLCNFWAHWFLWSLIVFTIQCKIPEDGSQLKHVGLQT